MTMQFEEVKTGLSKEMPEKIVIYGRSKIGKSRFAADAPDAFFLNLENGLSYIGKEVRSTPQIKTYDDAIGWLKHIYENENFTCGTLIIDSIDWLEELAQARLIKLNNAKSITDPAVKSFGFFRGVVDAATDAAKVLQWCDAIYKKKGIKAILIAHSVTKEVDLPNQDNFSQYQLKLSKQFAAKVMEWADLILHCDYAFHVTSDGKTTEPKPVMFTGGDMSYQGGGRMKLSKSIPISYAALESEICGVAKNAK